LFFEKALFLLQKKQMKLYAILFFLFVNSCSKIEPEKNLTLGSWGSIGIDKNTEMQVLSDRINFDFTCASAWVTTIPKLNNSGEAEIEGIYFYQQGNVPIDYDSKKFQRKAKFTFKLSSENTAEVKIFNLESNQDIGSYTYNLGTKTNVFKCP
jgi:hypothetical protein